MLQNVVAFWLISKVFLRMFWQMPWKDKWFVLNLVFGILPYVPLILFMLWCTRGQVRQN